MDPNILEILKSITIQCKYTKWYISIINNALNNIREGYTEKHHIIPKSFDTLIEKSHIDSKSNLVKLTAKEHFIVHLLLLKMFKDKTMKKKMNYAFFQLKRCNQYQHRYVTSRLYDLIKKEKRVYHRLYIGEKVYYVDVENAKHIEYLLSIGATYTMTESYKIGRVGNMKGKKHTLESKEKIRKAHQSIEKTWLKNISHEDYLRRAEKGANTKRKNRERNPLYYEKADKSRSEKMRAKIDDGTLDFSGEKNPRFGAIVSKETREKIAVAAQRRNNNGLSHREVYDIYIAPNLEIGLKYSQIAKKIPYKISAVSVRKITLKFREESSQ
jgi:hypothetical protein